MPGRHLLLIRVKKQNFRSDQTQTNVLYGFTSSSLRGWMLSQHSVLTGVYACVLTSEGEEGYPDDNVDDIVLPLRYQTDLLFTR